MIRIIGLMKNFIKIKYYIVAFFILGISVHASAQCFDDANVRCPNPLIAPAGNFCGPNPAIIRNALGWGIDYNGESNTFDYIDGISGNLRQIPASSGIVRKIFARVNTGSGFAYLVKKFSSVQG